MDTWAPPREFVPHPAFGEERRLAIDVLDPAEIDPPLRDLVARFAGVACCYTLQSCYGHFLYAGQADPHNLDPVPARDAGTLTYRIAYLSLCIENSPAGAEFRRALAAVTALEPGYVHFGSPGWFWDRWPNSYSLQLEPARVADRDAAVLTLDEARRVEEIRPQFFRRLQELADRWSSRSPQPQPKV